MGKLHTQTLTYSVLPTAPEALSPFRHLLSALHCSLREREIQDVRIKAEKHIVRQMIPW